MRFLYFLFWGGFLSLIYSQQSTDITQEYFVYGKIIQKNQQPIPQVNVSFLGYENETYTDHEGKFFLKIPKNSFKLDLIFKKKEFESQTVPIEFPKDKNLTLEDWILPEAFQVDIELPRFDLNSLSFGQDEFDRSQIGSVLHSQRDAFLNVSAFQFGNTFFRLRGLDSSHNIISINGIQMNSFDSGRPLWSQWGGLNDFTNRGQQFNYGLSVSDNDFGGLLGNTEINLRPSLLSSGSKVSQAFSNTTYQIRTMFSHSGSIGGKGIYYALLVSYRGGKTGYAEGTPYDAKSIFIGLEKNWNKNHNTWLTAFYTPNRRGKSAPMTQEVFDLKGRKYNPYWGFQDQKVRNSREAEIKIPVVILNHLWEISKDATFKINLGHQWGKQSSSRLLYNGSRIQDNYLIGGGQNPDPTYYQKLPSYFLRNPKYLDPASAYLSLQTLIKEGQIDWAKLYEINQNQTDQAAIYALYQDVKAPTRTTFSFEYKKAFESGFKLDFEGNYINENNHFFATPNDLLGADHVFNLNYYADDIASVQNNLLQPNKKVRTDDPFLYNYNLKTEGLAFSLQGEFNRKGFQGFTAIKLNQVTYQRDGKFKNGSFPDNSFGKGDKQKYTSLSTKAGVDYAFTGKHRIFINGGFLNRPPTQQNVFSNPRENHQIVPNTKEEESISLDFGYHFQGSKIALKALGYWIEQKDLSEVSYYFADGVGGDNAYFIQEILSDIQKDNKGVEFSIVYQPIPEVKITGVASVGQFTIGNDPDLYLSTVINEETTAQGFENGLKSFGKSKLKGYSLAAGPHQAFSLGFEYEDPNYWRLGIFGNYFSNAFLDPNPLLRTENFLKDFDGLTFTDYDPETAQSLLKQIQFPSYFLLNLTAGKSWRVNSKFFGFFLSFQNLLDETFKTGGFEQGRNANYAAALRFLLDETALNNLYPIGRKVYVNLNGLGAGYHRGVLTIGTYAADGVENLSAHLISAHLVRSSEDHLIIPLSINIEDFNQEYLGMWISINAVQFSNSELGKTFSAEGYDEFDGERRLVNCQTQQSIWVTTSTFSKFKSVVVSDHSGVISGILTRDYYNEKFILKINEPQNISFQDPRCDPFFNQHFENENLGKFESEGWISFTEEGTPYWKVVEDEYALGRSASFSAYSSGDTETIGWLITPPINVSSINNPVFAFRTAVKYPDKSQLEVYFSNDFNGNIDGVLSAQWQKLALKIASKIDVSNAWIDSGEFELPAQSENIYFAFKYIGNGKSTYDATFLVDDIRVMEGNQ